MHRRKQNQDTVHAAVRRTWSCGPGRSSEIPESFGNCYGPRQAEISGRSFSKRVLRQILMLFKHANKYDDSLERHIAIAIAAHDRLLAHWVAFGSIETTVQRLIDARVVELMEDWRNVTSVDLPCPPPEPTFRPLVTPLPALPKLTRPEGGLQLEQISDQDVQAFIRKPQRVVTVGDCFALKEADQDDPTLYQVVSCNLVAGEVIFGIQFEGTVDASDVGQTEMTNLLRWSRRVLNLLMLEDRIVTHDEMPDNDVELGHLRNDELFGTDERECLRECPVVMLAV
ncbi:hypothetical protein BU15DRAFT_65665 [Melanogaster broomeanus]|nr:hypothetical protein BU15DRAFT_65665 [Melanogaster broomeanus]